MKEKDNIWSFFRPERSHWKRMQLTERRKLYPYTAVERMDVPGCGGSVDPGGPCCPGSNGSHCASGMTSEFLIRLAQAENKWVTRFDNMPALLDQITPEIRS